MSALVIDAHPNPDSLISALAAAYASAHDDARLLALRDLEFDVHMRYGYTKRMQIEPDLADARQAIRDADHIVIATPVWWRSVPALLKGFLDRALLPQEDYRYKGQLPEGLLKRANRPHHRNLRHSPVARPAAARHPPDSASRRHTRALRHQACADAQIRSRPHVDCRTAPAVAADRCRRCRRRQPPLS